MFWIMISDILISADIYMIVLNVIGVLVIRSATNMNADAVNKQL
mgnify:CR=1 FL=1